MLVLVDAALFAAHGRDVVSLMDLSAARVCALLCRHPSLASQWLAFPGGHRAVGVVRICACLHMHVLLAG